MRVTKCIGLGLALLLAAATPSRAQVELQLYGGAVFPLTKLADSFAFAGATAEGAEMSQGVIFGGSLGYLFGSWGIEANVGYWPSDQIILDTEDIGGATVDLGVRTSSNVLLASGNILYHFSTPGTVNIMPYLKAGAGVISYGTDQPLEGALFVKTTNVMWNIGIGAKFPISPKTALRVEVGDYMNSFDFEVEGAGTKLQHYIVATVGLSIFFGG